MAKFIMFANEIICITNKMSFWIENRGKEYSHPYCVNLCYLQPQDFFGEPPKGTLIRNEGFATAEHAIERRNKILKILNEK